MAGMAQVEGNSTTTTSKQAEKPRWKTIKVPEPVYNKIDDLSKHEKKAKWQIIAEGIECYERERSKNWKYRHLSELDRVSYYTMKLMTAVERFKLSPSQENLVWIEKTVNQIKERLGVDIGYVVNQAKRYMKTKDKDDYVELNMLTKLAIGDIIRYKLS